MPSNTHTKKEKKSKSKRGEYAVTLTEHVRSYDEFITMHDHGNFYLARLLVVRAFLV